MNEITRSRFLDGSWRFERGNHDPDTSSCRRGRQQCHVASVLLVRPCISPSISLIKRAFLDNFQPALPFHLSFFFSFLFSSFLRTFSPQEGKRAHSPSNFPSILPYSLSPPRLWTRSYCSTHEHKATRVLPESTPTTSSRLNPGVPEARNVNRMSDKKKKEKKKKARKKERKKATRKSYSPRVLSRFFLSPSPWTLDDVPRRRKPRDLRTFPPHVFRPIVTLTLCSLFFFKHEALSRKSTENRRIVRQKDSTFWQEVIEFLLYFIKYEIKSFYVHFFRADLANYCALLIVEIEMTWIKIFTISVVQQDGVHFKRGWKRRAYFENELNRTATLVAKEERRKWNKINSSCNFLLILVIFSLKV